MNSVETKIKGSYEPLDLSLIIDDLTKTTDEMKQNSSFNSDYEYFIKYCYLLKLRDDATEKANEIIKERTNVRKSHL